MTKVAKPRTGTPRGEFGIGVFGRARFGNMTGRQWDKEAKSRENFTKVAKP